MRVAGAVLAAGLSTRMTRGDKLLLSAGDRPLLRWPVEAALAGGLRPVAVVVGAGDDDRIGALSDLPVEILENPDPSAGLATSLARALEWAEPVADAVALILGDEPGIAADAIERVVAAWRASPAPLARARYDDRPGHPVIVRLPPDAPPPVGDVGFRDLIASAAEIRVAGPAPLDVDTDEDYRELLARLPR